MKKLAILGAGGHGKVVGDAAVAGGWDAVCFFDDAWPQKPETATWPVVGTTSDLLWGGERFDGAVVAIGNNLVRLEKQAELSAAGVAVVSIIHPAAVVSSYAHVGEGSVIFAGAVLNPFARLGRGCILNTGASVDHDCELADGVHVAPGAHLGGIVKVGKATTIGIGASVKQCVSIGACVVVGGGAAVVGDVSDGSTVVGVPAKVLERRRGNSTTQDGPC